MRVAAFVLLVVSFGLASSQSIIKRNYTGDCSANNTNCDWLVGVWNINYRSNSYSCSGLSPLTQPVHDGDVCCTRGYSMPGFCVYGYREEDGHLVSECIFQEARFFNRLTGVTNQRTIQTTTSLIIHNLNDGLNYSWTMDGETVCTPFRQLTTDSLISNSYLPVLTNGQPSCPEFPSGDVQCQDSDGFSSGDGVASGFQSQRRRIPASRDKGYTVYKNYNTEGNCSLHNNNCDWLVGSWEGYVATQGYSYAFAQQESSNFLPRNPEDVKCALAPFFVPLICEFGYSTFTGDLLSYCTFGPARVTTNLGFFFTPVQNEFSILTSLHNGFQYFDSELSCSPMDRIDTDTIIFNVGAMFPEVDCTTVNTSPDTHVRCTEDGPDSENIAYAVLVRGYGDGTTTGVPGDQSEFSSASSLAASFMTLLCALYLLF